MSGVGIHDPRRFEEMGGEIANVSWREGIHRVGIKIKEGTSYSVDQYPAIWNQELDNSSAEDA